VWLQTSGALRREIAKSYRLSCLKFESRICAGDAILVIARSEATKQSILSFGGEMDCFAEPVIGRAFARPVGSQ
jgi:hypothetical protein